MASYDGPIESRVFDAGELMREHPPHIRDRNKQVVFDLACPAGCVHRGAILYSRWPARPWPNEADVARALESVQIRPDNFDYAGEPDLPNDAVWHVNFADPSLFIAYGSGLFNRGHRA